VEEDQRLLHVNKEGKDLQLGDGSGNQIKMKVRAMFLKLYATMPYTMAFQVNDGVIQAWQRPPQEVAWDQHPSPLLDDITSPLNLCSPSLSFFRGIPSPSHIHHCQFTLCSCHNNIFKGSELKVDDGQLFFQGNKENADLQLEGRGGAGRINQTKKTKVRAFSL
jgi:hypothetical protein